MFNNVLFDLKVKIKCVGKVPFAKAAIVAPVEATVGKWIFNQAQAVGATVTDAAPA